MLLTTRGIFRFDHTTKEIYLAKLRPGVTVNIIKKEIPWDLKVADSISQTEPPTDEEIYFIRTFAPTEAADRKVMYELGIINAMKKVQARQKGVA
jgi:glutaconate CoA-transferase subunit B